MAPASSSGGALSRRGRYLLGATVLLAVVLTAVLVPLSKQRNKASTPSVSAGGVTDSGDKVSYNDVMTALLVGNKNEPVATGPITPHVGRLFCENDDYDDYYDYSSYSRHSRAISHSRA